MRIGLRKTLAFIFAFLSLALIIFVYGRLTDGFSIRQITMAKGYNQLYVPQNLPSLTSDQLHQILDQPFYYLDKGCQFYVFESKDQKYILKFFKHKHLRPQRWMQLFLPKMVSNFYPKRLDRKTERFNKLIQSCELAVSAVGNQTGVLYFHMFQKPICHEKVTLIDKLGMKHRINLDTFDFAIQKKGVDARDYFSSLDLNKQKQTAKEAIYEMLVLFQNRCQHAIADRDRAVLQNTGYLPEENKFMVLDFGQLYLDESAKTPEYQDTHINTRLKYLYYWSVEHLPELVPIVQEVIDEKVQDSSMGFLFKTVQPES